MSQKKPVDIFSVTFTVIFSGDLGFNERICHVKFSRPDTGYKKGQISDATLVNTGIVMDQGPKSTDPDNDLAPRDPKTYGFNKMPIFTSI